MDDYLARLFAAEMRQQMGIELTPAEAAQTLRDAAHRARRRLLARGIEVPADDAAFMAWLADTGRALVVRRIRRGTP